MDVLTCPNCGEPLECPNCGQVTLTVAAPSRSHRVRLRLALLAAALLAAAGACWWWWLAR